MCLYVFIYRETRGEGERSLLCLEGASNVNTKFLRKSQRSTLSFDRKLNVKVRNLSGGEGSYVWICLEGLSGGQRQSNYMNWREGFNSANINCAINVFLYDL